MTLSWPISSALAAALPADRVRGSALIGMGCGPGAASFPLLPYAGPGWQPAALMLLLGMALGQFQLPLIVGAQSSVGWAERATATPRSSLPPGRAEHGRRAAGRDRHARSRIASAAARAPSTTWRAAP